MPVTFDVKDWVTTNQPESYYADGASGLRGSDIMQEMFVPLLDKLEDENYDFSSLDKDAEGDFDHLVVIHSGYSAEIGSGNDGCATDPVNRIWSQGTAGSSYWYSLDSRHRVSNYMLAGAFNDCKGNPAKMGIIVHEYMHGLGRLIDLYDLDYDEEPILLGGTGRFGLMSNLYGWYDARKASLGCLFCLNILSYIRCLQQESQPGGMWSFESVFPHDCQLVRSD